MPQIQNVSPVGDLDVPLLRRIVRAGEVVDVTEEQATRLLPQEIWAPADGAAEAIQSKLDEPADEPEGEVTGDDVAE